MAISGKKMIGMALLLACAMPAGAEKFVPGLVIQGMKHDKSFNEMALAGAERFRRDFGVPYIEAQAMNNAQNLQALRAVARRGATMVVAVGNTHAPWIPVVAREFPRVRFVLIDSTTEGGRNIESIRFREQEGSFLAGMAAALKSKTHTIGFIGGQGIPAVLAWGCGYVQGARHVDKKIRVIENMVSNTALGFSDPARGAELARSQFNRGADVVFAAANLTTLGVLQQARDAGKLGIGVDSNQNYLQPGSVLTSVLKRVDNVVYDTWKSGMQGQWKPGVRTLGLRERALDWAIDQHNRALIPVEMERRINAARDEIVAGRIRVADYRAQHRCPVRGMPD